MMFPTNGSLQAFSQSLLGRGIGHFAANELMGGTPTNLRLLTIWAAKGGESEFAALVKSSNMDEKMLAEDPRLEYVAVTRAKEKFYYVGFGNSACE
jgi:ATP-dependent exoDNAse (exonuclease V) beta subunit